MEAREWIWVHALCTRSWQCACNTILTCTLITRTQNGSHICCALRSVTWIQTRNKILVLLGITDSLTPFKFLQNQKSRALHSLSINQKSQALPRGSWRSVDNLEQYSNSQPIKNLEQYSNSQPIKNFEQYSNSQPIKNLEQYCNSQPIKNF